MLKIVNHLSISDLNNTIDYVLGIKLKNIFIKIETV